MDRYKVEKITEADYGCEECNIDGPHAYVYLSKCGNVSEEKANQEQKRIEVSEAWLSENGIKEGTLVVFDTTGKMRKLIRVVAAIIVRNTQEGKEIFATQRGYGEFAGGWEFPGGKIEENETPEEAIKREIQEELETEIEVTELLDTVEYDYPNFHLSMDCFICKIKSGNLVLKEHMGATWLTKENLYSVDWLPADEGLIGKIEKEML